MRRHFHEELKHLRQKLLQMSFAVQEAISDSCEALFTDNEQLASRVITKDETINWFEIEIDKTGRSLFAIGQPMAGDLRAITMILKINTDLERIGDHAVNIAEKTLYIKGEIPQTVSDSLQQMAASSEKMLRNALDSFLREDVNLARNVLVNDDEVDRDNAQLYGELRDVMAKDPSAVTRGINLLMVSHNLERIADLACNIAEDVIYMMQGREVRHHVEDHNGTVPTTAG
ncbi:MAG: phosphate signaling complex protein PhoU [Candidatus Omnitrophota bacterium]|nr:phosphate signaling complex protein PhoU [Candidatus Omnitrophota bacterium]